MSGIDENVAVIGDWSQPSPSPRTLFSSFLGDDISPRTLSTFLGENTSKAFTDEPEKKEVLMKLTDEKVGMDSGNSTGELISFSSQKASPRGGLAERMAARAGFNAPRLNTWGIRPTNILSSTSSEVRSPYFTIPPGVSPTSLLDSPVFLSNSMVQPSPTTGKLLLAQSTNSNSGLLSSAKNNVDSSMQDHVDNTSFVFKPQIQTNSSATCAANKDRNIQDVSSQAEPSVLSTGKNALDNNVSSFPEVSDTTVFSSDPHSIDDQQDVEGGPCEDNSSLINSTQSEDGYNWRKYGQKQVKGSEHPRSYYKCTHPNCPVKKKVERSQEGLITEIIYKGDHNHARPPPNRRSTIGCSYQFNEVQVDVDENQVHGGTGAEVVWTNSHPGTSVDASGLQMTSVTSEFCDPSTSLPFQSGGPYFESVDGTNVSSTLSNDGEEDDTMMHGCLSMGGDGNDEELESKRRKSDNAGMEINGAARALREPRVVVQTTSEVDILDDGYRWRKYGQKVVKGNPNPRSYYKCTNPGCTVRKHVERASHDLKSVITTYEGKHNHDVPAARNSSHVSSLTPAMGPTQSVHHNIMRSESTAQPPDKFSRFDGFSMPGGRQQFAPMPGFSFGVNQQDLANITMASFGTQAKHPTLPMHRYIRSSNTNDGFVIPKGEPKEEPMMESGLPTSVYQQLMNGLPL